MHGLGNDYVYVNIFEEHISCPEQLARVISDRNTGVGGDGIILIGPSRKADVRMEMYNSDGSRGRMCGNGIRCVAKYVVDRRIAAGPKVTIETDSGIKIAHCTAGPRGVQLVRVDMGIPSTLPSDLPCTIPVERIVNFPLNIHGETFHVTCVSMGNPHAIVFVDDLAAVDLAASGRAIETAPEFPARINADFVRVDSPDRVSVRTWERGAGATRACGTGASAVCVAGVLSGRTGPKIVATLPGGELTIEWMPDRHIFMTGPAEEVFDGVWPDRAA